MTNFPKELEHIILDEYNNVNDKLIGINFLEAFKFNLITKLPFLSEFSTLIENLKDQTNLIIEKNSTKLEAIIFQNKDSISQLKKKIQKSTLLVVLDGELQVDLFQEEFKKEYTKFNIYRFMGICLPSNTIINLNSFKNSCFIEFLKTEINNNIENSKKDII